MARWSQQHPMARLLTWLNASSHRQELFWAVARLNAEGIRPDQQEAMTSAHRPYEAPSHLSNGSQAIRDLVAARMLVNANQKRGAYALEIGWELIGVLSDWQEENGNERLDLEIRAFDAGNAIWRPVPDIFDSI